MADLSMLQIDNRASSQRSSPQEHTRDALNLGMLSFRSVRYFAEYIHAETNWEEQFEERDQEGYWDDLETIYDELMTFIYDTKIDTMPSRLELLSGGYDKLWDALYDVAEGEYQTQMISKMTKEMKRRFKGKWKLSPEKVAERQWNESKQRRVQSLGSLEGDESGNVVNLQNEDLSPFEDEDHMDSHGTGNEDAFTFQSDGGQHMDKTEEYYTDEFQEELDREMFLLKQSDSFNKTLSELEVMKNVSKAFGIPLNAEFEGHCGFAKDAEREWKDFGSLAKELVAFQCYYRETCFSLDRQFVDTFELPSLEDIAWCKRADLNYAILRWHGGHKRVENRIRGMKLEELDHPMYGRGKSRDEMLMLEHGSIWQFKALPPPPTTLTDKNLMLGEGFDPMFLPEALPTNDMLDPTAKVVKNKRLAKKIRDKKVTLLLS